MKLKDKKIKLLRPVYTSDAIGNRVTDYEVIGSLWAYYRQLSGKEISDVTTHNTEECLFRINYRKDITTDCLILYHETIYNVMRIDTFEGYRNDLTLYCAKVENAEEFLKSTPHYKMLG